MALLEWLFGKRAENDDDMVLKDLSDRRFKTITEAVLTLQNDVMSIRIQMAKIYGRYGSNVRYDGGGSKGELSPKQARELQAALSDLTLSKNRDVLEAYGFKNAEVVMEWTPEAEPNGTLPSNRPIDGKGDNDKRPESRRGPGDGANGKMGDPKGNDKPEGGDHKDLRGAK